MRRTSLVVLAFLTLAPATALASDGGQASVDPKAASQPQRQRLPDDIALGDGLYMCARMDCSPPGGGAPRRNIVAVPNGNLALNANGDIVGVDPGGPANGQVLVQYSGGAGYDGP